MSIYRVGRNCQRGKELLKIFRELSQAEGFGQGKFYTVNDIYTRNTVNEVKKLWYRLLLGMYSLCRRLTTGFYLAVGALITYA